MPRMDWKSNDCATPEFAVGAGTRVTRRCSRVRHLCLTKLFEQSSANMIHLSRPTRAGGLIPQRPNRESESRLMITTTNKITFREREASPQTLNRQEEMIRSHDRSTTNERKLKHTTALQPDERPSFEVSHSTSDAYKQNNCSTHVGLINRRLPQISARLPETRTLRQHPCRLYRESSCGRSSSPNSSSVASAQDNLCKAFASLRLWASCRCLRWSVPKSLV